MAAMSAGREVTGSTRGPSCGRDGHQVSTLAQWRQAFVVALVVAVGLIGIVLRHFYEEAILST
jgi:hypothetical protein